MGLEQRQADGLAREFVEEIVHRVVVAEAFRHLFAFHHQVAVVHPEADELLAAVGAGGLGDLVLVVGEDQVLAAAVDIEGLAQVFLAHGRALQVPPGAPAPPRAVPAGLAVLGRLPQHEVRRVLLVGGHLDPGAGDQLIAVVAGKLAVGLPRGHVEQHVAIGFVGVAAGQKRLDERDHLADVLGGLGLVIGLQDAQGRHVLMKGPGRAFGDGPDVLSRFLGRRHDLVVHVGDVAHVGDAAVKAPQEPVEHVEHDHRAGVADVGVVVDRGAANVEADPVGAKGPEVVLGAAQGVVEAKGHGPVNPLVMG